MKTLRTSLLCAFALAACDQAKPAGAPPAMVQSGRSPGPLADGQEQLPPGHPPLPDVPAGRASMPINDGDPLPPGHPPLDGAPMARADIDPSGPLPAGHPPMDEIPDSRELLQQVEAMKAQLKDKPKSFEISAALGSLYYDNGRYADAQEHYGEALAKAGDAFRLHDALARKPATGAGLSAEAAGCDTAQAKDVQAAADRGLAHLKAGRTAQARACLEVATRPLVPVLSRRANAFFLAGKAEEALAGHARALTLDPDSLESLFFSGAILYDTRGDDADELGRAHAAWTRFLEVAPAAHPRRAVVAQMLAELEKALALGGTSKVPYLQPAPAGMAVRPSPMAALPPVSPELMEAFENTPRGPELDAALEESVKEGEAALARNDGDDASNHFRSVLPYQPNNPRVQAGMAAAQLLKGSPMAERVLSVAVASDPKAVEDLAARLEKNGNPALAKTLRERMARLR